MNKKVYLAPQTAMVRVLTEGTFAGSVVQDEEHDKIVTTGHAIDEYSGFVSDDKAAEWNDGIWN